MPYSGTPEEIKAKQHAYYERNRERIKARSKQWIEEHRKQAADSRRRYAKAHPEVVTKSQERWQERNPGLAAQRTREWYAQNKERHRESIRRRDERILAAWVENVRREEVFLRANGICGICGEPVDPANYETDHIQPLSAGGEHSYANVQLAHPRCNDRKGTRWPWPQ